VEWNGKISHDIEFVPTSADGDTFELEGVTIGVNFHWERKENQRFHGSLRIVCHDGTLTAINIIPAEDYLVSVISSEMSATSSAALLRAHAVISRSWLMARINSPRALKAPVAKKASGEVIRWWDHEDHDILTYAPMTTASAIRASDVPQDSGGKRGGRHTGHGADRC